MILYKDNRICVCGSVFGTGLPEAMARHSGADHTCSYPRHVSSLTCSLEVRSFASALGRMKHGANFVISGLHGVPRLNLETE